MIFSITEYRHIKNLDMDDYKKFSKDSKRLLKSLKALDDTLRGETNEV